MLIQIPGVTQLAVLALTAVAAFSDVREGSPIPSFSLPQLGGGTFDSKKDFAGTANVVVFCRADQEYTERLLRELQSLYDEEKGAKMCVAAIFSGDTDSSKLSELKSRLGLRFPILLDKDRSVYGAFGVIVAPATGFVDAKGILRFYYANYRRDFATAARANVECLLGKISAGERETRVKPSDASATSNPALSRYRLGKQLLNSGDLDGAEKALRQAWESDPKLADAGTELGYVLLQRKKDQDALKVLTEAVKLAPDNMRASGALGVALMRTGQGEEGKKRIEEALAKGPATPFLCHEIGVWSEEHQASAESLKYYKMGLEAALNAPTVR